MAKPVIKPNPKALEILVNLEHFLEFCRYYGYRFNEADLGNGKSYAYQQFTKYQAGKRVKDMWLEDAKRFGLTIENAVEA
jgi:hypothetical protein